ncbi:MAG TPA: DUF5659 domain-containing protein [Candidatus Paceibacterota bacterium]
MSDKNEFRTKDFYLACYALTQGAKITYLDRVDPRRAVFVFENVESGESLVRDFLYRKALVDPQDFVEKIKVLKQLLHSDD